jgi:hypothetical protein
MQLPGNPAEASNLILVGAVLRKRHLDQVGSVGWRAKPGVEAERRCYLFGEEVGESAARPSRHHFSQDEQAGMAEVTRLPFGVSLGAADVADRVLQAHRSVDTAVDRLQRCLVSPQLPDREGALTAGPELGDVGRDSVIGIEQIKVPRARHGERAGDLRSGEPGDIVTRGQWPVLITLATSDVDNNGAVSEYRCCGPEGCSLADFVLKKPIQTRETIRAVRTGSWLAHLVIVPPVRIAG